MDEKPKKKPIRPHKGGRTERFECRATTAVKDRIIAIANSQGVTTADVFEQMVLKTKLVE